MNSIEIEDCVIRRVPINKSYTILIKSRMYAKIDMIQFRSLSFDDPAKWFFLGIVFYLVFIVAIAVTAMFYIQLEINLTKKSQVL